MMEKNRRCEHERVSYLPNHYRSAVCFDCMETVIEIAGRWRTFSDVAQKYKAKIESGKIKK